MSTKHHYAEMEREYHDAYTYLRLMRRIEKRDGYPGDYYDPDRNAEYFEAEYYFEECHPDARRAARASLSMRGQNE